MKEQVGLVSSEHRTHPPHPWAIPWVNSSFSPLTKTAVWIPGRERGGAAALSSFIFQDEQGASSFPLRSHQEATLEAHTEACSPPLTTTLAPRISPPPPQSLYQEESFSSGCTLFLPVTPATSRRLEVGLQMKALGGSIQLWSLME